MAEQNLSYYLGPDLSAGLLNLYRPIEGLLNAVRRNPVGAARVAAENVGPQADIKGMVDSSRSAMQNFGQGNIGAGLLDAAYVPANAVTLALPMMSASGMRRAGEGLSDSLLGMADTVDPSMPAKLVNPEMRVFQGGPGKYGPDIPGTKPGLDSSKIGTGEGAQAYGHGHYVAENMGVAKQYQPRDFDLEEKLAKEYQSAEKIYDTDAMEVFERAMLHEQPEEIAKWLNDPENVNLANSDSARGALARYRELMADVKGGHLYEYDLPDETIAKMLDWDKPLSEQPESVRRALGWNPADEAAWHAARKADTDSLLGALDGDPTSYSPSRAMDEIRAGRPSLDSTGEQIIGGDKLFADKRGSSVALRELGIPGIRYLDQGSRGARDGTSNFVIFDDDAATLLARDDTRFDQGLLGDLPMDDASRMDRARDMGVETNNPLYHGTPDSRGIYESGFSTPKERYVDKDLGGPYFFTDMSRVARSYADDSRADDMQNATPEVIKTFAKNNKPLKIDARKAPFREIQLENVRADLNKTQLETLDEMMPDLASREVDLDKQTISTDGLVKIAKALGNDSVLIRNVRDSYTGEGSPSDVLAVFDRRSIRSVDAKFDPAKKDSSDILANLAGLGLLGVGGTVGSGLLQQPQQ